MFFYNSNSESSRMTSDTNEAGNKSQESMNQPIEGKDEMTEKVVHCSICSILHEISHRNYSSVLQLDTYQFQLH